MSRGRSLHIGLNRVDATKYKNPDGTPWDGVLSACENDAANMRALAVARGFEASSLLTAQATADAILAGIREASEALGPGDIFFLTYSGHGGQVPDQNGDEPDQLDETWVAFDRQLVDDELAVELTRFAEGVRLVIASDSCHSGTVARRVQPTLRAVDLGIVGLADDDLRFKAMPHEVAVADATRRDQLYRRIQTLVPDSAESEKNLRASVLLIAACRDDQLSAATPDHSLYTAAFVATLTSPPFTGTYPDLRDRLEKRVPDSQTPILTALGREDPSFVGQRPLTI
jgi:hypothetical protein